MISSERPAWRQPSLTVGLLPLSNRREQSPELPPQASIWLGSELRVALFAAVTKVIVSICSVLIAMFTTPTIQHLRRRSLWAVSFLMCLSLWHVTIAAMLCPFMNGAVDYCGITPSPKPPLKTTAQSTPACAFHQQRANSQEVSTHSRSESADVQVDLVASVERFELLPVGNEANNSPSVSLEVDGCGHCMLHSETQPTTPGVTTQVPQGVDQSPALEASARVHTSFSGKLATDFYHDGPPGRSSPRYVLNSEFRL